MCGTQNRVILVAADKLPLALTSRSLKMQLKSPVRGALVDAMFTPVAGLPPVVVPSTSMAPAVRQSISACLYHRTTSFTLNVIDVMLGSVPVND